jgi:hypothetical protein
MFNPKVSNPNLSVNIPQMRSYSFQTPFFFGGSQVPNDLGIAQSMRGGSINRSSYKKLNQKIAIPKVLPFR